jgi:LysR family hydrogen peroxide-inducible transcriptional activator
MTLTELRYIVALAQEQHFGRAAERCHVSQPTLSIAVKKLEEELGVLFERGKTRILPTPLGMKIVAMAAKVLEQAAAIKDVAEADKGQLEGPIALGTLPTIGPYLLPQFIPLLQETTNKLSLYVEEGGIADLAGKLRNGDLDALLVTTPFAEADVVVQPLFDEPFVLLLPSDHRLASKVRIEATDLRADELLLLGEGDSLREQILAAFPHLDPHKESGAAVRTFTQGATLETLRHMVASHLGITILPQTAAEAPFYSAGQLVIRPFASPSPRRTLALSWRASFPRHKAIDILRKTIEASSPAFWTYGAGRQDFAAGILVENKDW